MYAEHFFKLENFIFHYAIIDWSSVKVHYGMDAVTTLPWESVRMKLTFPKLGLGSPSGLPKL
jgi:hypothetical protein